MDPATRERLLDLMLLALDERGRDALALADVLTRAGVSKADFFADYDDEEDCLFVAYDRLGERLRETARRGCAESADWPGRVLLGLRALLAELAARPAAARVLTRGFPSLGPAAQARYQAMVAEFAPLLSAGRTFSGVAESLPGEVEMLAVGAAEAIIVEEIATGRTERLPAMAPAILFSLLVPFLGPGVAAAEMEKALRA